VGRIRRPGGGRQRVEKKFPHILVALEDLLRDDAAGELRGDLAFHPPDALGHRLPLQSSLGHHPVRDGAEGE
jgi:hypothetical protein